jgi:hypothetical protein
MTTEYAALELRLSELERQMPHELSIKIDAANYDIGLVHQDTQASRGQLNKRGAQLDKQGLQMVSQPEMLEEILRRLPGTATTA